MPNNVSFVKFQRGSAAAYAALQTKDLDTLYFIYDKNNASAGGLLYLGDTLIGGTGSMVGSSTLAGLSDVDLTGINDGALLQYNAIAQQWEVASPSDLTSGGISVAVGTLGENETVAQAQSRLGGASPNEGDIVIISGESYVYDGSQWQSLKSSDLEDRVSSLETTVGSLQSAVSNVGTQIANAISNANHLTYSVVGSLQDIDDAITENGSELHRTVFLVPNMQSATGNLYDEYMVVNTNGTDQKELLGNFGSVDFSNYVTTSAFNTSVGNLSSRLDALEANANNYVTVTRFNSEVGSLSDFLTATGKSSATVFSELVNIYEMLEWHELNN